MPSLATAIPNQLQLLAVPAGWESCTSNHSIPRLLLLACLLSMVFLALQLTVSITGRIPSAKFTSMSDLERAACFHSWNLSGFP